jgi:hypothetical protein
VLDERRNPVRNPDYHSSIDFAGGAIFAFSTPSIFNPARGGEYESLFSLCRQKMKVNPAMMKPTAV